MLLNLNCYFSIKLVFTVFIHEMSLVKLLCKSTVDEPRKKETGVQSLVNGVHPSLT